METGVGAMKGETNTLSVLFDTPKSLFRNIFHITPLNSKILQDFPPNSMIPKDRGGRFFLYYVVHTHIGMARKFIALTHETGAGKCLHIR